MTGIINRACYITPVVMGSRNFIFSRILLLVFVVLFLCWNTAHTRYNAHKKRVYKPKTDSVSYQDRAKKFRRGLTVSKTGDILAYLGTGLVLTGIVLDDNRILLTGGTALGMGLPTIGFGSMYMKSSILSEATMKPNGFPWFFTAAAMVGGMSYLTTKYNFSQPVLIGNDIIISSLILASWVKFVSFRNLMARRYSEYTFNVIPVLDLDNPDKVRMGIQSIVQF